MNRLCYYTNHYPQSTKLGTYKVVVRLYSNKNNQHEWQSKTNVIITNPTLLTMESCSTMNDLKQIHAHMTRNGLISHTFPASRVLAFCALSASGDIRYARALFARFDTPNTYMWNTMVRGCSRARFPAAAFDYFVRMVRGAVELDGLSFVYALMACEKLPSAGVPEGESVFCLMTKMGFGSDLLARNGLVRFFVERRSPSDARKVFDESPVKDVVTWTTVIDGYAKRGSWDEALGLFESMLLAGVEPNEVTLIAVLSAFGGRGDPGAAKRAYAELVRTDAAEDRSPRLVNAALDMLARCGCLAEARAVFDGARTKDVFSWTTMVNAYAKSGDLRSARALFDSAPEKNEVSWSAMISGYSQNSRPEEALELFQAMTTGEGFLAPTEHALVCALSSCARLGRLDLGRRIHRRHVEDPSAILGNALVDMYAKCGSIDEAAAVFAGTRQSSASSWNAMIGGYAAHGRADRALAVFEQMRRSGTRPDPVTFVAVLAACSRRGLVAQGKECFESMARDFGVGPGTEHYSCLVDLLGRNGLVEEAYGVIRTMPMEPGKSAWGALLNASKIFGNVEMAEISARKLLELDPEDSGVYVSWAHAMAGGGRWGDARKARTAMRVKGVKKSPGRSAIEIDGEFHWFLASDESHSQFREIYEVLNNVYAVSNFEASSELNVSPICERDCTCCCCGDGSDFSCSCLFAK